MARRRRGQSELPALPPVEYRSGDGEQALVLRAVMTAKTREQYRHETSAAGVRAAMTAGDVRERALEFLFERLVCGWTIAGLETTTAKQLLARYRAASREEREWITSVLREHCGEWFPDVQVP